MSKKSEQLFNEIKAALAETGKDRTVTTGTSTSLTRKCKRT